MKAITPSSGLPPMVPALVVAAGERAGMRFLEFFAANIRNPHTRRAYARAADEFLAWCAKAETRELAAPSVKQRPVAVRRLFDWLVTGQVVPGAGCAGHRLPASGAIACGGAAGRSPPRYSP